jgi:hypothetical protein
MRTFITACFIMLSIFSNAQVPESFNYQAIPRNGEAIYPEVTMDVRISILSGSPTGSLAYSETFNATTTSLGLLNLQIGAGTPISGTFISINWGTGIYYMKVEIDTDGGGSNYIEMGTTQLLSVPYALHAKNVDSYSETQTISDVLAKGSDADSKPLVNVSQQAIGTSSPDPSAALDVSSTTQGFLPPRMTHFERDLIASPEAGLQVFNTTTLKPNYFNGTEWLNYDGSPSTLIGARYAGGIVFYVDGTGQHGLVCTETDIGSNAEWGCKGTLIDGADGVLVGTGAQNTADIEIGCATVGTAADLCANYEPGVYGDWFLPSKDELYQIYNKLYLGGILSFGPNRYWSSSEDDLDNAWGQFLNAAGQFSLPKDFTPGFVRAVRAF